MLKLTEIIQATSSTTTANTKNISFSGVSTDTRTIKSGDLFVALKGKHFDGHDHIEEAFQKGAKGAVVSEKVEGRSKKAGALILVSNTLKAYQDIARHHRSQFKTKIVAVTGSSGKTTTKDMIASVLSQKGKTLKTEENFNNEIGVPKTLLQLDNSYQFAVIEMGMQGKGEIELLSYIAAPDIAVITNVGEAHIQRLQSIRNIAIAKSEILKHLAPDGISVLNSDDEFYIFFKKLAMINVLSFGVDKPADFKARNIRECDDHVKFDLVHKKSCLKLRIPLPGKHNVYNALAAAAVGMSLDVKAKEIQKGIGDFKPSSRRMDITILKNGVKLINDSYNANPSSMKAALKMLSSQKTHRGKRIAVIGDMLELGDVSLTSHEEVGKLAADLGIEALVGVGKLSGSAVAKASSVRPSGIWHHCKDNEEAAKTVLGLAEKNDVILLKASRGMKFEEIAQKIIDSLP